MKSCNLLKVNQHFASILPPGFLLGLFFNPHPVYTSFFVSIFFSPEDRGNMFVWNLSWLSPDYAPLCPRR
jgi:hypothetical protein